MMIIFSDVVYLWVGLLLSPFQLLIVSYLFFSCISLVFFFFVTLCLTPFSQISVGLPFRLLLSTLFFKNLCWYPVCPCHCISLNCDSIHLMRQIYAYNCKGYFWGIRLSISVERERKGKQHIWIVNWIYYSEYILLN